MCTAGPGPHVSRVPPPLPASCKTHTRSARDSDTPARTIRTSTRTANYQAASMSREETRRGTTVDTRVVSTQRRRTSNHTRYAARAAGRPSQRARGSGQPCSSGHDDGLDHASASRRGRSRRRRPSARRDSRER
eukprot:4904259-Prymnesium_polylepis.1